jgi:hypothetical protein
MKIMIKKEGSKYCLYSKDGSRKLGEADTMEDIKKREQEVNYYKNKDKEKKKKSSWLDAPRWAKVRERLKKNKSK